MTKALVCGAGIGGLAAAVALKQAGLDVVVFERSPQLRTAGSGLTLWPNGVRVLHRLGLGDEFEAISTRLARFLTMSSDGNALIEDDLEELAGRFGAPMAGVHRLELNALLARALGHDRISFRHALSAFRDVDGRVECRFESGECAWGDVLIGADGIHSTVRRHLFGEFPILRTGQVRWRGIFEVADVDVDPEALVHVLGDRGHFGWLGIGNGRAYWYATGVGLAERAEFLAYFRSWTKTRVPNVIRATPDDTIIRNELLDPRGSLRRWGERSTTLLGDAAHPMLPGMAQGACQALEDAATLAPFVSADPDLERALRAYESARMPITDRIMRLSREAFESARVSEEQGFASDVRGSVALVDKYYDEIEAPA